jgi:hypothetical protein
MLEFLRRMDDGDCLKLRYFFYALYKGLASSERTTVFEIISDELKTVEDDGRIISFIQIIKPIDWLRIQKLARLRIENRIIESINQGIYSLSQQRCTNGVLGTWATGLFPFFTLKKEAYTAICERLFSNTLAAETYALKFMAKSLPKLSAKPNYTFQAKIREKLKAGQQEYCSLLSSFDFIYDEWYTPFESDIASFMAVTPPPIEEDDVPF